jgi:hypothetical protein
MKTQNDVYISKHAQENYRKFTKFSGDWNKTLTKLIYMMDNAEAFEPDPEYKVKSLIRHKFRPTEYFLAQGYVMVVVNGSLATLFKHKNGDKAMWRAY